MTAEALIDGIVGALHEEFGERYRYLTDNNEQALPAPCFLINVEQASRELFHDRRYYRTFLVSVTCFPERRDLEDLEPLNAELNNTAERLFDCLEVIQANGHGIRGHGMTAEKSDGALVFTVTYELFEIKLKHVAIMRSERTDTRVEDRREKSSR